MAERVEIVLGGRAFVVRPLTIGQLMDIADLASSGAMGGTSGILKTLEAALKRDYPEMTAAVINETESTLPELMGAFEAIQLISGLVTKKTEGNPTTPVPAAAAPPGPVSAG